MTDVAGEMDQLRIAVGEVDALAAFVREAFDRANWRGADEVLVGRMGHVLGVLAASAMSAMGKFERFQTAFVDAQPAPTGESWDYEGRGTAEGPALSAQDAEIVRRIRERCPDTRYDGGSADELIELFRRNKRVLSRGDEDVIAAMTHPR